MMKNVRREKKRKIEREKKPKPLPFAERLAKRENKKKEDACHGLWVVIIKSEKETGNSKYAGKQYWSEGERERTKGSRVPW